MWRSKRIASIEDLRRRARRRVPRLFFDYVDGGSGTESTMRANSEDFARIGFNQALLVDVAGRSLAASYLGGAHALPFFLAPTGFAGLLSDRGEAKAARAAGEWGIPYCASISSICSFEEIRAASSADVYLQLTLYRDRGFGEELMARAAAAGAKVLFLTVDAPVMGRRERDIHNGFFADTRITPSMAMDFALHPRWLLEFAFARRPGFGNFEHRAEFAGNLIAQAGRVSRLMSQSLTWADVEWVRSKWSGLLVVKGVMSASEARAAVQAGADAVGISNHGGRQLDGAPSTISVLPEIAEAVGGRAEIIFDSGIRRGADIVKALALGADACMIGRAYLYGLAAGGAEGVRTAIRLLRDEIDTIMALTGVNGVEELRRRGPEILRTTGPGARPAPARPAVRGVPAAKAG